MQKELTAQTVFFRKRWKNRKLWKRIVTGLASVVVFCTTYALILPAITLEGYVCGLEAHQHDENCYAVGPPGQSRTLVCDGGLGGLHQHDEGCYADGVLICGYADYILHTHGEGCYDSAGALVCPLEELEEHQHDESCRQQPHVHGESCYTLQRGELICRLEEGAVHLHGEDCRVARQELICPLEESAGHSHTEDCCSETLICGQAEGEGHSHTEDCMERSTIPDCGMEADEGHAHTEGCRQTVYDLVCTMEEDVPHVHTDECYAWTPVLTCTLPTAEDGAQPELICGQEERRYHIHDESCWDENGQLACGLLQTDIHTHNSLCYLVTETAGEPVLVCEQPVHIHDESCLPPEDETESIPWDDGRACGMAEHEHGGSCYNAEGYLICTMPEHTHWELCDLDPNKRDMADPDDSWLDALPVNTGDAAADLTAVALAQVGYRESDTYYTVTDEGEILCYSRYADWWDGDGFADWNASLAAFCLEAAEVRGVPLTNSAARWPALLAESDLWQDASGADPQAGVLAFFDRDGDGAAESVGIITEAQAESDGFTAVLEQNGRVRERQFSTDNATLMGYGLLSREQEAPALGQEEAERAAEVSAQIDALPTDEEIAAALAAYEDEGDEDGYNEWLAALMQQVQEAVDAYNGLTPEQQAAVTNAERLTELEWLWNAETMNENFSFTNPTVVASASTKDFIELNLYDYNGYINDRYDSDKKYPGFQWNGGAYMYTNTFNRHTVDYIDFGNSNITDRAYEGTTSGITNGVSKNKVTVGVLYDDGSQDSTGKINWLWRDGTDNTTITNRPVGMSIMGGSALSRKLGDDVYPALSDGTSLSYLFKDGTENSTDKPRKAVFKQNTQSIDGLFQKDEETGAYYYNSRENHAQYSDNKFTLYEQIITPNFIVYPFGNFLPFNDITSGDKATQVSGIDGTSGSTVSDYVQKIQDDLTGKSTYNNSPTSQQLNAMLEKYQNSINTDGITAAKQAISDYLTGSGATTSDSLIDDDLLNKLYNIDWDEETNFFFGMDMSMNFMQPKDGLTGNDGKQPMVFYFTGDDDVWVYIDGVLFLDLSGIHRHVGGEIDFVNGVVKYYALDTQSGDVSSTPYKTYTFAELLEAAGKFTDGLNEKGTFKDYTTHSFKFYYMERGSGSSVCRMNFNFPLLQKNSITVTKELSVDDESKLPLLGDPDFKFQVLKEGGEELFITAGTPYEILDATGTKIGTETTDENDVFTLKAGQTAVFSGIEENAGKYFVRELLDKSVAEQYGHVTVSGSTTLLDFYTEVTIGSETFKGANSPVQDASDGSTVFRFNNQVETGKLGQLEITKKLLGSLAEPNAEYSMVVKIDDEALPVGTSYLIGDETRSVQTEGIIPLKAGQTATLENILAGTEFTVTEAKESAEGFTVSYRVGEGDITTDHAEGTVGLEQTVSVIVTNQTPYELPETGGGGAGWYYAVGSLLCITAAALLPVRKRRRKGDAPF